MAKFDVQVSVVEPGNFDSKIGESFIKRFNKNKGVNKDTLYQKEWDNMLGYFKSDIKGADAIAVAKDVEHALFDEKPKMRYMIVPNQREADITLNQAMLELVQLNQKQAYSVSREELIKRLDAALAKLK